MSLRGDALASTRQSKNPTRPCDSSLCLELQISKYFFLFEVKYCQLVITKEKFIMEFFRNNKKTIILVITFTFILMMVAGMIPLIFM